MADWMLDRSLLELSFAVLLAGAFAAALCGSRTRLAGTMAVLSSAVAAILGIPPALDVLFGWPGLSWEWPWPVPIGRLSFHVDTLSAFFLLFILIVSVPVAVYGRGYMERGPRTGWRSLSWTFFLLLELSMLVVVSAADGFLFLVSWEVMSITSLLLVLQEHEKEGVAGDGLAYAVASHLGAAALLAMFALWGTSFHSLNFVALSMTPLAPKAFWAIFFLSLAGFGCKAGLIPFHVWLPRAHPSAPSHVSALMSGVMIKMGVYGILRVMALSGGPRVSWGVALLLLGGISCVGGVLLALAQHDIKRLLAYHSVENVGIIFMGIGGASLAHVSGSKITAGLLASGALFHVLNHGLFKSLLFCAGGAAAQAAGTREMSAMGGLLKRMPLTGSGFLVGAMAICTLPPFNGLVSELLIYAGLLRGSTELGGPVSAAMLFSVPLLAFSGGLALLCFAKVFGVVFLGEPRSSGAGDAAEPSGWMTLPVLAIATACAWVGILSPYLLQLFESALRPAGFEFGESGENILLGLSLANGLLWLAASLLAGVVFFVLKRRIVPRRPTWGCGFESPTARMQYTASSFAAPLLDQLGGVLRPDVHMKRPQGFFPASATFHTHLRDPLDRWFYGPVFLAIFFLAKWLRPLQQGRLPAYVAYILVALVAALLWGVLS